MYKLPTEKIKKLLFYFVVFCIIFPIAAILFIFAVLQINHWRAGWSYPSAIQMISEYEKNAEDFQRKADETLTKCKSGIRDNHASEDCLSFILEAGEWRDTAWFKPQDVTHFSYHRYYVYTLGIPKSECFTWIKYKDPIHEYDLVTNLDEFNDTNCGDQSHYIIYQKIDKNWYIREHRYYVHAT